MEHIDQPKHWEFDEIVNRNIASYWPRRNQLYGIIGAPKNAANIAREYLFPGDKLVSMSDYRMKGFPENYFRYPRIPFAMRDHFLGEEGPRNYGRHFRHGLDEKPDLCGSTPCDLDMSEIEQWKHLQRRNAAEEQYRKTLERQKILRLLQEEVESEREKYWAAKERLVAIENEKETEKEKGRQFPPIIRSSSPDNSVLVSQSYPRQLGQVAASDPGPHFSSSPQPTTFPPIRQSLQRDTPSYYPQQHQQEWQQEYNDVPNYEYNRNISPSTVQNEPIRPAVVEQTQTEPLLPATVNVRTWAPHRSMPDDYKKRYLEELRQAADMRREKWRREREEMRSPFVDTITMLGADKPRWPGSIVALNPSFHTRATDVTRPGMFLQFY